MTQEKTEKTWEELLTEAIVALEKAEEAMEDIAGWSGSSGHWGLHSSLIKVRAAIASLTAPIEYK